MGSLIDEPGKGSQTKASTQLQKGVQPRKAQKPPNASAQLSLWSLHPDDEQMTSTLPTTGRGPPEAEGTPLPECSASSSVSGEDGGEVTGQDWQRVLMEMQVAVEAALQRSECSAPPCEPGNEHLPLHIPQSLLSRIRDITWRITALAYQLSPKGAICFRPFTLVKKSEGGSQMCGQCGSTLEPSQGFECQCCMTAKNLALGFLSWYDWLAEEMARLPPSALDGESDAL